MKNFFATAALLTIVCVSPAMSQLKKPDEPRMMFVSINVTDLDSSAVWYEKMLLLKTVDRSDYPALGYRQADLKNSSLHIELVEYDSAGMKLKDSESETGMKPAGIAKLGFTVKNFREWVGHLLMQDASFAGGITADRTTGKPAMTITDPDRNMIIILEE
ncbi:MAG: VOC family protein [Ignavibacteria bacterium]|nr:VOC family protein [Ignavibacteria bacterium]